MLTKCLVGKWLLVEEYMPFSLERIKSFGSSIFEFFMEFVYLYCILTLGQGIFLSIYLLRTEFQFIDRLLAVIMLIEVFTLYDELFLFFSESSLPIWLYYIGTPLMAAVGPLVLGYVYFLQKPQAHIKSVHFLHFLPALLTVLIAVSNYHVLSLGDKVAYVIYFQQEMSEGNSNKSFLELLINNVFRIYTLTYLIVAWRYLLRSNNQVYSPAKKWFSKLLISGFILVITITFILEWFPASSNYRFSFFLIIFSSHIFALTYIYFNPPKSLLKANKYRKSGLTSEDENDLLEGLKSSLDQEEVYKDPLLTLPKLAKKLGTNGHYLSQIINSSFNKSFNELINEYRVKDSCALLSNDHELSIEEVADASGFASSSSFFRVFKKQMGQTPAKYRKSHLD